MKMVHIGGDTPLNTFMGLKDLQFLPLACIVLLIFAIIFSVFYLFYRNVKEIEKKVQNRAREDDQTQTILSGLENQLQKNYTTKSLHAATYSDVNDNIATLQARFADKVDGLNKADNVLVNKIVIRHYLLYFDLW